MFHGEKFDGEANSQIELVDDDEDNPVSTDLVKRKELYSSVKMEKSSVTFLSPTAFDQLYNSSKYNSKFDLVFLSVSNSKKIDKNLLPCLKPNGLVVLETAKYVLDLKKEQQETHLNAGKLICLRVVKDAYNCSDNSYLIFSETNGKRLWSCRTWIFKCSEPKNHLQANC